MYIITCVAAQSTEKNKIQYFAIDNHSGGYPYWSRSLNAAKFFTDFDEAIMTIEREILDAKNSKMSDGTVYPAPMVHSGLGLCNKIRVGTAIFSVQKIKFDTMFEEERSANLQMDTNK